MPTNIIPAKIEVQGPTDLFGHYRINYDVDRFSFVLSHKIENMDQLRKNYDLDWGMILDEYQKVGLGDVPHFASQYVFAWALNAGRTSEREEMQTMYIEIVTKVNRLIETGVVPSLYTTRA